LLAGLGFSIAVLAREDVFFTGAVGLVGLVGFFFG